MSRSPRTAKSKLFDTVVRSLEAGGWVVNRLSPEGDHPLRLSMERAGERETVRVYIWNLTHGGGPRSDQEFRVQITGIDGFQLEPNGTTLLLGWSDAFEAFAAFDAGRRTGTIGASPSIQLLASTLNAAAAEGAAVQTKRGEFAVAVRPDRLALYVRNHAAAHRGDISSIRSDPSMMVPHLIDPESAPSPRIQHLFGSPEELEQRRFILARIEALEAEVERLKSPDNRGHNNPPELLPEEDASAIAALEGETASLKDELGHAEPDAGRVQSAARFLRHFVDGWRRAREEAKKFGGKVADKAREKGAELVIGTVIGGAATWGHIVHAAEALTQALAKWFGLI
jgi:hypothetical protein